MHDFYKTHITGPGPQFPEIDLGKFDELVKEEALTDLEEKSLGKVIVANRKLAALFTGAPHKQLYTCIVQLNKIFRLYVEADKDLADTKNPHLQRSKNLAEKAKKSLDGLLKKHATDRSVLKNFTDLIRSSDFLEVLNDAFAAALGARNLLLKHSIALIDQLREEAKRIYEVNFEKSETINNLALSVDSKSGLWQLTDSYNPDKASFKDYAKGVLREELKLMAASKEALGQTNLELDFMKSLRLAREMKLSEKQVISDFKEFCQQELTSSEWYCLSQYILFNHSQAEIANDTQSSEWLVKRNIISARDKIKRHFAPDNKELLTLKELTELRIDSIVEARLLLTPTLEDFAQTLLHHDLLSLAQLVVAKLLPAGHLDREEADYILDFCELDMPIKYQSDGPDGISLKRRKALAKFVDYLAAEESKNQLSDLYFTL